MNKEFEKARDEYAEKVFGAPETAVAYGQHIGFTKGANWAYEWCQTDLEKMMHECTEKSLVIKELQSQADALAESLKFTLHCVRQTPWIAEGPKGITNPMFLGTGSVEGDQAEHEKYLRAEQALNNWKKFKEEK